MLGLLGNAIRVRDDRPRSAERLHARPPGPIEPLLSFGRPKSLDELEGPSLQSEIFKGAL
jgi:hypothetical protein